MARSQYIEGLLPTPVKKIEAKIPYLSWSAVNWHRYLGHASPQLPASKCLAEIGLFVQRADSDLTRAGHRIGAALHPFDRFIYVRDLPQPETGDQLPDLGERAVDEGAARAVKGHALALR